MVPPSGSVSPVVLLVAPTTSRSFCQPVQPQVAQVCVSGSGSDSLESGRPVPPLRGTGYLRLSPVPLRVQVFSKLVDQGCLIMILIEPGWPNMPCFWDPVSLSVQKPLTLPQVDNLLSQPFSKCFHRNLKNLRLHAWPLEPRGGIH